MHLQWGRRAGGGGVSHLIREKEQGDVEQLVPCLAKCIGE